MLTNLRTELQITIVMTLSVATLVLLSLLLGSQQAAFAQLQPTSTPPVFPLTAETLQAFGLATDTMHASNVLTFDLKVLKVLKSTTAISVESGTEVTYTVHITNTGPNPADGVFFHDAMPSEMINPAYMFSSNAGAISNGATNPADLVWLFTSQLPVNETVVVTVTGELTSARSVTVTNTAMITTHNPSAEVNSDNNNSSTDVGIKGYNPDAIGLILYMPIISKFPTPTPAPIVKVYDQDFNDDDAWYDANTSDWDSYTRDNRYWIEFDDDDVEALPPADNDEDRPDNPFRTYGEFEVTGYQSEGNSNGTFGIFINGEGGDDYYYLRIFPNNGCSDGGNWQLRRRKDGNTTTLLSGNCETIINRGYGSSNANTVRLGHKDDRTLTVYINGVELGQYVESSSNERRGEATGIYTRSDSGSDLFKFDDFRVYEYQ